MFRLVLFLLAVFKLVLFVITECEEMELSDVEFTTGEEMFVLEVGALGVEVLDEFPALVCDVLDEFPTSDVPVSRVSCAEVDTTVEFDSPNAMLELSCVGPMEKAYCGKTNTVATETKSRTLRSISFYIPNSANKELLHIVQEQCY